MKHEKHKKVMSCPFYPNSDMMPDVDSSTCEMAETPAVIIFWSGPVVLCRCNACPQKKCQHTPTVCTNMVLEKKR
jgi:hypothetical protein